MSDPAVILSQEALTSSAMIPRPTPQPTSTPTRLRIDRKTLSPLWHGERLDVDPILGALLPRRIPAAA
jgi:hypothetical protein